MAMWVSFTEKVLKCSPGFCVVANSHPTTIFAKCCKIGFTPSL